MNYNVEFKIYIFYRDYIFYKKKINYIKIFSNGIEIYAYHYPILFNISNSILLLKNNNINKNLYFFVYKAILEFSNNKLNLITNNLINYKNLNLNKIKYKKNIIKNKISLLKNNYNKKYFKYYLKLNLYNNYLNLIKLSNKN